MVLLALGFVLALPSVAAARGQGSTHGSSSSAVRARALWAYRHDRALGSFRLRRVHGGTTWARTAMVNGTEISIEQAPWQVAVLGEFEYEGEDWGTLCGGAIVDMSNIVTAAHCTYDPFNGETLPPEDFVVLAGASRITAQEIVHGATVEGRFLNQIRVHPYYDYAAGPGAPDDVAVLGLEAPLVGSEAVAAIALPSSSSNPIEGTTATVTGFGEENPLTKEINGNLYSLAVTLDPSSRCGGEADALLLCAINTGGSTCNGDSGGGLFQSPGAMTTLIGLVDTGQVIDGEPCRANSIDGFVNVTAPEIRDFIEGDEVPPRAPRGGGANLRGVFTAGHTVTCEPGTWSDDPSFTYTFVDSANEQVLQQGSSGQYALSEADVGRTISCHLEASNAGGTARVQTVASAPVGPAPVTTPPSVSPTPGSSGGATPEEKAHGGVLGYQAGHIGMAEIEALLRHEIVPASDSARTSKLLSSADLALAFKVLEAGAAVVDWYELPAGASLTGHGRVHPILVATGRRTFAKAGTAKLVMTLTAAGRRLLAPAHGLKLTARGTFTPSGGHPIVATRSFELRG